MPGNVGRAIKEDEQGRIGLFQKYANECFAHRKDAKVAEKMFSSSGGERPPEQKPPSLRG
jgi:hypothetical protein